MDETPSTSGIDTSKSKIYKSNIWDHFSLIKTLNKSVGQCKYCNKSLKTEFGCTTGLIRHLQNKHYAKYLLFQKAQDAQKKKKEEQNPKLPCNPPRSKDETSLKTQSQLSDYNQWPDKSSQATALTEEIGKWMASSLHSYSLADEEGLKKVLYKAQPRYRLPSSKTFSRKVIPKLVDDVKSQMKTIIEDEKPAMTSMSVTLDMWTSRANNSFLAVTHHFMNKEFKIENLCLGCYSLPGEHSGQNIDEKLTHCLREWGLNDMTIPIYSITDNAKNIKHAMALHGDSLKPLNCFAHTLQLALRDAKNQTQGLMDLTSKVRKLVGHYKHSAKATERLHNIQKLMGKDELQMVQDCETRWNSEFLMLSRLVENKEPLCRDITETGKIDNLTISEWRLVQGYVDILAPIYQATTEICSATIPTCSMVVPILYCIISQLESYKDEPHGSGKMFAANLLKTIKTRFPNKMKTEPYLTAMLLDPRFKDIVLDDEGERQVAHLNLKTKLMKLENNSATGNSDRQLEGSQGNDTPETTRKKSLWDIFNKAAAKRAEGSSRKTSDMETKVVEEMKIFFGEPCINNNEDPCLWWKKHKDRFPFIQQAATQYMAIPATEVASERTFSSAGNVVTELRERLTSEHVEELVFLHQNKRFYM